MARDCFAEASEVLGRDMMALCFDSDAETLARTENAQPALFTVSMAAHRALDARGVVPAAVSGFSLGECVALCAAGVLSWGDGLRLVGTRARAMQACADRLGGAMSAVLGLSWDAIEALCREVGGFVQPVNDNCPGQTVIAGEASAVEAAETLCLEAGASRAVRLGLSGAFHTATMAEAGESVRRVLSGLPVSSPKIPLFTNLTGQCLPEDADLPAHMAAQLQSPVRFQSCVQSMLALGVDCFVEAGSGRTLAGFVKRIDRGIKTLPCETPEQLETIVGLGLG